jgi:hypothetical protein
VDDPLGTIVHSGGMCDAAQFHAAIDEMSKEVHTDLIGVSMEQARENVLMMVLMMVTPAGRA